VVLRRDGVLEPPDVVRFEGFGEALGRAAREGPVAVEGDVGAVADGFGRRFHDLDLVVDPGLRRWRFARSFS